MSDLLEAIPDELLEKATVRTPDGDTELHALKMWVDVAREDIAEGEYERADVTLRSVERRLSKLAEEQ